MEAELPDDHYLAQRKKEVAKEDVFHLFVFALARMEEVVNRERDKLNDAEAVLIKTKCSGKCHVEKEERVATTPQEEEAIKRAKLEAELYRSCLKTHSDDLGTMNGFLRSMKIKLKRKKPKKQK
jgi:hypothetical protein